MYSCTIQNTNITNNKLEENCYIVYTEQKWFSGKVYKLIS